MTHTQIETSRRSPTQAAPAARPAPLEAKSPAVLDGIGATAPFAGNGKCWDPVGFTERTEDSLMLWYRAAELKHSRVAMLACAGWIVNGLHLSLPGTIDYETKFSDLAALPPLEAFAAAERSAPGAAPAAASVWIPTGEDYGGVNDRYRSPDFVLR